MSLLVVGSLGLDNIETPFGKVEDVLGGSVSYFSIAASIFTDVKVVAVVGEDFPDEHLSLLRSKGVDLEGVQKLDGKTFRWHGRYGYDLGDPETLATHLNASFLFLIQKFIVSHATSLGSATCFNTFSCSSGSILAKNTKSEFL